jgi:two-component system phosphate regulon sensor histidine kinase PhoR
VFERFYRVDKSRSRNIGGTGLGLSIVKHITEAHKGKVWVESQVGKGSKFYIKIPKIYLG